MSTIPAKLPNLFPARTPANPIVEEWLSKAIADVETASRELAVTNHPNFDAVCFHAQQAVEKLTKGILIDRGVAPPFTHDLGVLAALIAQAQSSWTWTNKELRLLTLGAVQYRNPGFGATKQDATDAFDIVCRIWPTLTALL